VRHVVLNGERAVGVGLIANHGSKSSVCRLSASVTRVCVQ
jgi:hypothetical protein